FGTGALQRHYPGDLEIASQHGKGESVSGLDSACYKDLRHFPTSLAPAFALFVDPQLAQVEVEVASEGGVLDGRGARCRVALFKLAAGLHPVAEPHDISLIHLLHPGLRSFRVVQAVHQLGERIGRAVQLFALETFPVGRPEPNRATDLATDSN